MCKLSTTCRMSTPPPFVNHGFSYKKTSFSQSLHNQDDFVKHLPVVHLQVEPSLTAPIHHQPWSKIIMIDNYDLKIINNVSTYYHCYVQLLTVFLWWNHSPPGSWWQQGVPHTWYCNRFQQAKSPNLAWHNCSMNHHETRYKHLLKSKYQRQKWFSKVGSLQWVTED